MFSKEEQKEIKQTFWKGFKTVMNNVPSSTGKKVNWLNYPTKLKIIYVRCEVDDSKARFSIDIQAKDEDISEIVWEQFQELKTVIENEIGSPGIWLEKNNNSAGQSIKSIVWDLENVSIHNNLDKDKIYLFLKEKLISFDRFYQEFNEILFNLIK